MVTGQILSEGSSNIPSLFRSRMRRKKKTTIVTFESRERITIRSGQKPFIAWCGRCCADVLMVTPNEAATVAGTDDRAIFRAIEAGEIHFIEGPKGDLLVCSSSLGAVARPQPNSIH